jgi:hypothetical protein
MSALGKTLGFRAIPLSHSDYFIGVFGLADIDASAISAHAEENKDMERDQVGNEDISTPSRSLWQAAMIMKPLPFSC